MSFLRAGSSVPSVVTPDFTGLQVQTSSNALPIPIVYGRTRIAPNIIWSGDFQSVPHYSSTRTGKGGIFSAGNSNQLSGYTYQSALLLGLCEGPIKGLVTAYNGQSVSDPYDLVDGSLPGTSPQRPWSYLLARHPQRALGYGGTALAYAANFDLGSSASIGSLAFEVSARLSDGGAANGVDADPSAIIYDFLTNAQYGVGFPADSIDATSLFGGSGDGSYQTYCLAHGLALSPALIDQEAANAVLSRWLELTNATAVWSGGRLRILPFGDDSLSSVVAGGATVTYQPSASILYDLNDDDFIGDASADPLIVTRRDPYSAPNVVVLEVLDRANQYSATSVEARDQGAVEQYGLRPATTLTAHEICDLSVAATAGQLVLQRGLYVRNTYAFKLSWLHCLLEPMDIVTLTDESLGLIRTPVRIVEIAEDHDGLLSVIAEEYPGQIGTAVASSPESAANEPLNRAVAPSPVNVPFILEPPPELTGGTAQIWLGLSGGTKGVVDPNWGGAVVFVSLDGSSYTRVGTVSGATKQGRLASALPPPGASSSDAQIDFSQSGATLGSSGDRRMIAIESEIVGFNTATLTSTWTYSLGGLARRLYGLQGGGHAAGAPVLVLDSAVFTYNLPEAYIGHQLWLKFASFNIFGKSMQDLATCVAYPFTPLGGGRVGPVTSALATGSPLDEGLASSSSNETDDFGKVADPYVTDLDLGLASEGAGTVPVNAGGTGGRSATAARLNIGAAAAGSNNDITALSALSTVTFNKGGTSDTASTYFKSAGTIRASAGLVASDRYRITVSSDGGTFNQALDVEPGSGHVGLAGFTADANNALGVTGTNFLFTAASDSCRFNFNKAASGFDAALTFQTNYSTRALLGLLGSDEFQLKVSSDGGGYNQVYVVNPASGAIAFKAPVGLPTYSVASLPAGVANGCLAFATNGRRIGEAAGAGTGVVVAYAYGQWRRLSDDSVVSA